MFDTCTIIVSVLIVICSNNVFGAAAFVLQTRLSAVNNPLTLRLENNYDDGSSYPPPSVICVGEALYDSLPSGIYLGGAPSNVAVHLASLFQSLDDPLMSIAIATCVGDDQLGREAKRRFNVKGVRTDYMQFHDKWETGMATAILDENGDATYEFNTPAAWDGLQLDDRLRDVIQNGDATKVYIIGTIAARLGKDNGASSYSTISTVRNTAREGSVVLDVNLRDPWYTKETVLELARGTNGDNKSNKQLALLKLNEEELVILEEWCGLESKEVNKGLTGSVLKQRMKQLATNLNTQRVCVTRGKDGAALLCCNDDNSIFYESKGYSLATNNDSDTVGAGDSFLAALVCSLFIQNESPERALEKACALGGYVASCRGATPDHEDAPDVLRSIFS